MQILSTFFTAGAATPLISRFRACLERDRTLRLRFKRPDGTELELAGGHNQPMCDTQKAHSSAATISETYRDSPSKPGTTMPQRTVSASSFRCTLLSTDGCAVIGSSGLRSP